MIIMILFALVAVLTIWACLKAGSDADDALEMLKQEETEEVDVDFEADVLRDAMKEEHW